MESRARQDLGQSTIEFIMTFSAAVGFIFLFLKMAMNYTNGYMVHHATFLAARAYLVSDENRQEITEGDDRALAHAKLVFKKYLPEGLVEGVNAGGLQENRPLAIRYQAFVGLWIEFVQSFSLGFIGGREPVIFRSEAFLGREPTRRETLLQTCDAIKKLGLPRCDIHATLEDNGG